MVEPVFGTSKEQRGLRQFHRRGLAAVNVEFTVKPVQYIASYLVTSQPPSWFSRVTENNSL